MTRRMLTIYLLIVSFILAQAPTHLRAQTASMTYAQVMAGSRLNPLVNVANDNCDTAEPALFSKQSLDEIAQIACANAIASAPVTESLIDGLLQSAGQCAVGIGETAVDIIEGVGAAIKMVVVETPTCAYQVTRNAVLRAYRAAKDAFGMASDAADANVSAQETCIDRAVVALSNISEIKQVIADQINLQFKQFQCMPAAQQSKMLCKLIAGVFASVVSPHMVYAAGAKAVSAARTSVEIVRKTTELMNAMKTEFGGPGVTVGETLDRATSAIHASASTNVRLRTRGHELYRFSDSKVVEYFSPKGEKILE
ncbi:MAG: hypothetical protein RBT63_10165, partial [Bdellovibrionales bacterium]|nr:hypothetical protein [Bdellovibrionales bacterium]